MLEEWQALIPPDVYENLERFGSGAYIPWLVQEAPKLSKIPYCVDATASYWARWILGGQYPLETADEYGLRHLATCQDDECQWCEDEKTMW